MPESARVSLAPLTWAACLLLISCAKVVMTPPTRVGQFESPQVLEKGGKSLTLSGGGDGTINYVNALGGSALGRWGLGEGKEAALDLSVLHADRPIPPSEWDSIHPNAYSANIRFKSGFPESTPNFSIYGGLGGGVSEPMAFLTLDAGFALGFENRWLIPYLGLDVTLDIPFGSKRVPFSNPEDDSFSRDGRALLTFGLIPFVGAKIPLIHAPGPASERLALVGEFHLAHFQAGSYRPFLMGGRAGLQFPVGF